MYFRSGFQDREEPYRIPENYSGNAFPEGNAEPESPEIIPSADESALPESSPPPEALSEKPPSKAPPQNETRSPSVPTFLSSWLPPKPRGFHGGILSDIGTEELLLLGLILLLSQNDSDDDIILLLLLLLFYK